MKNRNWILPVALIASIFLLITPSSCEKEEEVPTVTTKEVISITHTSAVSGGTVADDGGLAVQEKGICWGANPEPDLADNVVIRETNLPSFGCDVVGLTPNTTYYVRAYATNAKGTGYGASISFTTLSLSIPELTTAEITEIMGSSASCGGNVTADGGAAVTVRGVCWATSENPTLESGAGSTTDGEGIGEYTSRLSGLEPFTTYYVRAYATNSEGTAYGNQVSFTSGQEDGVTGTVTDVEGNVYPTIYIGGREWMAKNLRTRTFRGGTPILTGLSDEQWQVTSSAAYDVYPSEQIDGLYSEESVLEAYGALYNWFAATSDYGVCPTGWHVPSKDEWDEMIEYLVTEYGLTNEMDDAEGIGNTLKSCRQIDSPLGGTCSTQQHPRWNFNEIHYGRNDFGFDALPGGYKGFGYFSRVGNASYWWTTTTYPWDSGYSYEKVMEYKQGSLGDGNGKQQLGMSIRCVRD